MTQPAFKTSEVVQWLRKRFPQIEAIYLYGSTAAGQETSSSDIDLALLSREGALEEKRFEMAQEIAALCNREVDLVELKTAPTVFQFQVISKGKRIYSRDESACERFEDFVYKSYAKLNEERAGILKDIQSRGSIF